MVAADRFLMDRYDELGLELVGSDAHAASAYDAAAQGIILLKNDRKHLPLSLEQGLTVAVIGPHANSSTGHDSPGLLGSYNNEVSGHNVAGIWVAVFLRRQRYRCRQDNTAVLNQTMLLAARRHFGAEHVLYSPGCDSLGCPNRSAFAAATAAAAQGDVAVVFLGISGGFEAETRDRNACSERPGSSSWTPPAFCPGPNPAWKHGESVGLALPGNQTALALAVAEANPKTIVVLVHGGMVYLEEIVQTGASVVSALYPGQQGGDAVWDVLTGARPPAGKLPYTWCKCSPLCVTSHRKPRQNLLHRFQQVRGGARPDQRSGPARRARHHLQILHRQAALQIRPRRVLHGVHVRVEPAPAQQHEHPSGSRRVCAVGVRRQHGQHCERLRGFGVRLADRRRLPAPHADRLRAPVACAAGRDCDGHPRRRSAYARLRG